MQKKPIAPAKNPQGSMANTVYRPQQKPPAKSLSKPKQ
jgi:hypothetical protein